MIVIFLIFFFGTIGSKAACLPDSLSSFNKVEKFELKLMEETIGRFESTMLRKIPPSHDLVIRLETLSPRVNAEIVNENGMVAIVVWGGMLSHSKMTANSLMLLLCHELGHFLGGPPLKSRKGWSSTEGQADFFSTNSCLKDLGVDEGQFIAAALALTAIYAQVSLQTPPRLDECDQSIVTRTNFGYPGLQCRLDTLVAGWNETERPKCWFTE